MHFATTDMLPDSFVSDSDTVLLEDESGRVNLVNLGKGDVPESVNVIFYF